MVHERSPMQHTTQLMLPFIENTQNRHIYEDKKQINGFLGWGCEGGLVEDGLEGIS